MAYPPTKGKGPVANVLPMETRVRIISALVEGNSIRAVERMTSVPKSTILRLALAVGDGCERLHNRLVQGIREEEIELDEQWSFIAKKEKRVTSEDPADWGDVFTYSAFGRRSKLILSWHVGKRTQALTDEFVSDLRARILVVPQMTSDGLTLYVPAVANAFGPGMVDYAQVIKQYGYSKSPDHKFEPARNANFIVKTAVFGAPDPARMSTSGVERYHLTARHMNGRKRRLCLAFSKTVRGHRAAVALSVCAYNLTRIHASLRITPAMEAGIVKVVWSVRDLIEAALAEAPSAAPVRQPLTLASETGPVRQLPGGKGWLRLVHGGSASGAAPATDPAPPDAPAVPTRLAPVPPPPVATTTPRRPMRQLDLFDRDD